MKEKVWALGEYLSHLIVGALMFVALLAFGGALNMLVHWAAPIVGDPSFEMVMITAEKVLLYADAFLLIWWTGFSTYRAIKELRRS